MPTPLDDKALYQNIPQARTHNELRGRSPMSSCAPSTIDEIRPPAQTVRRRGFLFLSRSKRRRLRPALSENNLQKRWRARDGDRWYDLEFYEKLPYCFLTTRTRSKWFKGQAGRDRVHRVSQTARCRALISSLRRARWDCTASPMSGFDNSRSTSNSSRMGDQVELPV